MFLIDTHCHLNSPQLRAETPCLLANARSAGIGRLLVVGGDLPTSVEAVALARLHADVYAAVGIHPHDASTAEDGLPPELLELARGARVVAVGETGLDYHYDHSPREVQKEVFRRHIAWALCADKPLVIHVREAWEDTLELLRASEAGKVPKMVFHCYSGGLEGLEAARGLDAYLSLAGPVTWTKNDALREVAGRIPEDRLLLETDAPWLTPAPYRGKRNEPAYVRYVYETVASVRGVAPEVLARQVDANAARLFGWGSLY